jgi:hypothetical protein
MVKMSERLAKVYYFFVISYFQSHPCDVNKASVHSVIFSYNLLLVASKLDAF